MGSKSKIAKDIVPIIQSYIDENNIKSYYEPFCGGCNVIDKIKCENRYAFDSNKYLIELLKNVNKEFPQQIAREEYNSVRNYYNSGVGCYEDWYVGLVGFLASYNGRFFDGGYAKTGVEKTKYGDKIRNYYEKSKNNLLGQDLSGIVFECKDYKELVVKNALIYCDPPYKNTTSYKSAKNFDYDVFWKTVREWSKDNIVIISEQEAPQDFRCIWKKPVQRTLGVENRKIVTEKLFVFDGKCG